MLKYFQGLIYAPIPVIPVMNSRAPLILSLLLHPNTNLSFPKFLTRTFLVHITGYICLSSLSHCVTWMSTEINENGCPFCLVTHFPHAILFPFLLFYLFFCLSSKSNTTLVINSKCYELPAGCSTCRQWQ